MAETPERADSRPWYGVAIVVVALVATAFAVVRGAASGPRPKFLDSDVDVSRGVAKEDDGHLHLAGSGSDIPLVRILATAYRGRAELRPMVHASIGSGGGIRALLDGAIDVALVSRPLEPAEADAGLVYTPFATVPVIVGAHLDVADDDVSRAQLLDIFRGDRRAWSDGSRIVVLQREPGDSSHSIVARGVEGFAAANEVAYRDQAFRVLYHDSALQTALANTTGSVGLHGNGVAPLSAGFKALSIDGIEPGPTSVADGSYPFTKSLALVTRAEGSKHVKGFVAFVMSAEGQRLLREAGAVPTQG